MTTFVRVRDKETGHEFSISERAATADHLEILKDEPAARNGAPLRATTKTTAKKKAATGS